MRDLIKKVLRESEEETAEEFIARFEKDKKRIEKTIPKIVNFLKSGFDDYNQTCAKESTTVKNI